MQKLDPLTHFQRVSDGCLASACQPVSGRSYSPFDLRMTGESSPYRYGNHLSQQCVESGGKSGRSSSAEHWRVSHSVYIKFNDVFMRQEFTRIHRCSLLNDTANIDTKKTCGGFFVFCFFSISPDKCDSGLFDKRFPLLNSNFFSRVKTQTRRRIRFLPPSSVSTS